MAQHISRKELKKDEVREGLAHGIEAVLSHQQFTTYFLAALVVAALAYFGWQAYQQRETAKASSAFDNAMKIFQARIPTPGQPTPPDQPFYTNEQKKYTDAAAKFAGVAAKYKHTRPGKLATYYDALSLEKLGKYDDAREQLQAAMHSDEDTASVVRFNLAQLDDQTGRGDEAEKIYQQLIAKPTVFVPKPMAMFALAQHYAQKNPSEAAKLYEQIKSEYPGTPFADQADQALALLPGKS